MNSSLVSVAPGKFTVLPVSNVPKPWCANAGAATATAATTDNTPTRIFMLHSTGFSLLPACARSEVELGGDFGESRGQDARRRQPGASGDECLVIRLDAAGV